MIRDISNMGDQGDAEKPDYGIIKQAVANRWNIPEDKMNEIVVILIKDATDPNTKPRDRGRAIGMLIKMEAMNQCDQHLDDKNERLDSGKLTDRYEFGEVKLPNDLRLNKETE